MIYQIPIFWTMTSYVYVEAQDIDDAIEIAENAPLPTNGEYLDDSFEVNQEDIQIYLNKDELPNQDVQILT